MYNIDSKFKKFYHKNVILQNKEQKNLRDKKDINIERLKNGLIEYNANYKTSYELKRDVVQGSMAMYTVTQNDSKDYDIDVAIVFDSDDLPEGTTATKNIVVNALKYKCKQFNVEPEFKTNCVRIQYAEGYHIDFAIYRKSQNIGGEEIYEHCGSEWRERNPWSITQWFVENNEEKEKKLRILVRLLKMFAKSRSYWNMPGGLILSVLANESFVDYDRYDELLYYNMVEIRDRLNWNLEVYNPTDTSQSLLLKESDYTKMNNLKIRLDTYIEKLDVLFDSDCEESDAIGAWNEIFNHSYWGEGIEKSALNESYSLTDESVIYYDISEEYIEDLVPVVEKCYLELECDITNSNNSTVYKLTNLLKRNQTIPLGMKLRFYINRTNVNHPYKVVWKVKNDCSYTEDYNESRGQLFSSKQVSINEEDSSFIGNHYVECYIVKDNVCVAMDRINVPIGNV